MNLPYRFMYHLRNYSEHRGTPIARIKQTSTPSPSGQVEHDFDVLFDSRKLLHQSPRRPS